MSIDLRDASLPAEAVIKALGLQPHPEGGHYRETWRDAPPGGGRGVATAILFLLGPGEVSRWHRVDADELWLWHAGAPMALSVADEHTARTVHLGPDLTQGEMLQHLVPRIRWQRARSAGTWTLVTCVVAPAFQFAGFEAAVPGWSPPDEEP